MTTYRLTIADMGIGGLYLGTTNELEHTQIMIDISEWAQELESGASIGLVFTSPDGTAETIPYTMEGTNVILSPTSDGFYMPGVGEIAIMLIGAKGSIMVKATNETIVEAAPMMRSSAAGMPVMAAMPVTVPATRESVDDSQDERLNKLPHVTVSGRDLSIPNGIQEISVRGDSKSVRVVFHVPRYYDGIDLGMRSFFVEILNPLNQFDTVIPSTHVVDDKIIVTWEVQKKHAAFAGQVRVKLKATENGDYIWQTHTGYFSVTDTFDGGNEYIPDETTTAIDQMIEQMESIKTQTLAITQQAMDAANRAEGSAQSIQEAQDVLQRFEDTGLIMVDGKLCVQVERSESV